MKDEILKILKENGADLVGYCSLNKLPFLIEKGFVSGISIIVSLNSKIIKNINGGPTLEYYDEYIKVNKKLNYLSKLASDYLNSKNIKTDYWGATDDRVDGETLSTEVPHMTIATLSGIGWVGKCDLLVTKQFGSAIRLTSVLTNYNFINYNKSITDSNCNNCENCVKSCPANASKGINWYQGLHRDDFFDPFLCNKTSRKIAKEKLNINTAFCSKCIVVCPFTQKYIKEKK